MSKSSSEYYYTSPSVKVICGYYITLPSVWVVMDFVEEKDMLYESTRGSLDRVTGARGIIQGIAEDGGLFVPCRIPSLDLPLEDLAEMSYKEIVKWVLGKFFDEFEPDEISQCVEAAYDDKFTADDVVGFSKAGHGYFLELYHGKTAAFKDMALSLLPHLMKLALKKEGENRRLLILTATSGDTGKAALEGFKDVEGTDVVVFYPEGGVSQVQERQMVSQEGKNTHVFSIEGNFDEAQSRVKEIFADENFKEDLAKEGIILSSANSINIGRLVPQIVYYIYSYGKLLKMGIIKAGEPMNVSVPTGNFGNILGAYFAKEMGIPVGKFICASNENKVLADFFNTGLYDIRDITRKFILTNSPSMDILISSNLERLLYLGSGRDGDFVKNCMDSLRFMKCYTTMDSEEMNSVFEEFQGGEATEEETLKEIKKLWEEASYLMDTHTAVAYKVYEDYRERTLDESPTVIVSTASAYKFSEAVLEALSLEKQENGFRSVEALEAYTKVPIPYGLKDLEKKAVIHKGKIKPEDMRTAIKESVILTNI